MHAKPINLTEALASFTEVYSPRIVTQMNDYDVRIAHTLGEHVWHVHEDTDEFFLVLDGQLEVAVRDSTAVSSDSPSARARVADILRNPNGGDIETARIAPGARSSPKA